MPHDWTAEAFAWLASITFLAVVALAVNLALALLHHAATTVRQGIRRWMAAR